MRGIDWFDDDMGFTSCGIDGNVFFYELQMQKELNTRNSDKDFNVKINANNFTGFTDVCNIPGQPYEALTVGGSAQVWRTTDSKNSSDARINLSQVKILASGKAFFAGTGEESRPGSIQIWKFPMEKINEVQAHGKGIERMRISYDNNYLFTAGRDGTLMILDIKDRDPRGGLVKQRDAASMIPPSEEILTEKSEIADFETQKQSLKTELENHKNPGHSGVDEKMGVVP